MIAGLWGGGIFRSTDEGVTWHKSNSGLSSTSVCALAAESKYLFAGTSRGGIFRSRDEGRTWVPFSKGIADTEISALGSLNGSVFVSTWRRGIWRSTDHGVHWTKIGEVGGASCFYARGTRIFSESQGGIRISSDTGETWTWTRIGDHTYNVSSFTAFNGMLFAGTATGVYRSSDDGKTWLQTIQGLRDTCVFSLATMGTRVFAGTANGVAVSENGGVKWAAAGVGLPGNRVNALLVAGSCLVAGTSGGIYRSIDSGRSWRESNVGIVASHVLTFGGDERRLYAGTFCGGLFVSTDRGERWIAADSGMPASVIEAIVKRDSEVFAALNGGGIYRSSDGGRHWISANQGLEKLGTRFAGDEIRCYSVAVNGEKVYVGAGQGLFSSSGSEMRWSPAGLFPPVLGVRPPINALASVGRSIFAGCDPGIFQSTNEGSDWRRVDTGSAKVVIAFALDCAHLYAGAWGGVWRSSDSGSTWRPLNVQSKGRVRAVLARGPYVIAGSDLGVQCSSNHGDTWIDANEGLPKGGVFALMFAGQDVLAGTFASGVWRRSLSDLRLSMTVNSVGAAAAFGLELINQNPFNSTLRIRYRIPLDGYVRLTLLDINGRMTLTAVNEYQSAGSHEKSLDMKGFNQGIYFCRFRVGNYSLTRKVLWLGMLND